jgi:AcrR family transcriptional regulator
MRPDDSPSGRKRNPIIEEARRAQIIAATIETVATTGYAHASLAQIAQNAEISKSVISYHFSGKDELLAQVVEQIYEDAWAYIEPRLASETSAAGRLRAYLEANLQYMKSHRNHLLAIITIVGNLRAPDGSMRFPPGSDATVITLLTQILEDGRRDGEFRDFDPRVVAVIVGQALVGVLGEWAMNPGVDLDGYAAELVVLFDLATRR